MNKYYCLCKQVYSIERYSISPVQADHIENIRKWRNAQIDVLRQKHQITQEEQINYFQNFIFSKMSQPHPKNILVIYKKDDYVIGYGGLVHIAWEHRRAEISFLLDPIYTKDKIDYENLFTNFLFLTKILAFQDLKFVRIFTETFSTRKHHIYVLEKSGFIREGVLRKHVCINNKHIDSIIHGHINPDLEIR